MGLRGHLKMLILSALHDAPKSGYSLMNIIQEKTGHRPSAGSMYPLLEQMNADGLLTCKEEQNKKIYSLSEEGEGTVPDKVGQSKQILKDLRENVRMLGLILEQDVSYYLTTIEAQINGKLPFGTVSDDVEDLQESLFKLEAMGAMEKKTAQIRKIVRRANDDLKKLY